MRLLLAVMEKKEFSVLEMASEIGSFLQCVLERIRIPWQTMNDPNGGEGSCNSLRCKIPAAAAACYTEPEEANNL